MPEAGARVEMPAPMRLAVRGLQYFTWPLKIDDYISLINPLWSTVEARGRIERIHNETPDAVTVFIVPGFRWRGHKAGQYLRVGFDIDGKALLARVLAQHRRIASRRSDHHHGQALR